MLKVRNITSAIISVDKVSDSDMETCLIEILASKSEFRKDLAIINNAVIPNNLFRSIHELKNANLYVKDYNISAFMSPNIFVLYVQDFLHFEDHIDKLDRDWERQPEALFIVVLKDISKNNFKFIFEVLWDYHIIHVLVVTDDMDESVSIYSYFPYAKGRCGRGYDSMVKICDCNQVKHFDIFAKLLVYQKPDLMNCTLHVATHDYPPFVIEIPNPLNKFAVGIETIFLETLAQMEKFYLNYTYLPEIYDFGDISDNFTVSGILEMLYENQVDIVFGGFSLNSRRSVFFDSVYTHLALADFVVMVVPNAHLVERWKIVCMVFNYYVWLLLLCSLLLCAILLSDFNNFLTFRKESLRGLFDLFGSAVQNVTLGLGKYVFKNFIIISWMWFVFLVNYFYQTRLTSYSTYRAYKPQFDELTLRKYNITPCVPLDLTRFIKNSGLTHLINDQYSDAVGCETSKRALYQVAETQTKYSLALYLRYLWWITRHPDKKNKIYVLKNNFYNSLYAFFFKRGFPLVRKFNLKMLRFVEFGFVQAIKGLHGIPDKSASEKEILGLFEIRTLQLRDLIVPFSILIGGVILALLIFLIEILYKNHKYTSKSEMDLHRKGFVLSRHRENTRSDI